VFFGAADVARSDHLLTDVKEQIAISRGDCG